MSLFVEVDKPKSIDDVDYDLYYMLSNSLDPLGVCYTQVTSDYVLNIAYKVYKKIKDDTNKLNKEGK